ncbi:MAG: hypothetical protein FWE49_00245 [Synergistaceae bacterium]|nr:hypothetical protein [Synergistaceae bacterium]
MPVADNNSLAYIIIEAEEGSFRGAVLASDLRGIPVDFRYTEPIRPTKLEKVLYGNALEVYLKEELILESLIRAVEAKPALWICREQNLLAPLRFFTKSKAIMLMNSNHHPLDSAGDIESTGENGVYFVQADSVSAPLKITFQPNVAENEVKFVVNLLVNASQTMELTEPFSRMQKALRTIATEIQGDGK